MESTPLIAFDQHAATTVAAVLLPGQRSPALHSLTSDNPTILRFVQRLQREVGPVRCCYEAGPCGFELQRVMTAAGVPCEALTAIHIPTDQEEAVRDLLRCREDIRADLLRARHRLSKCLLRHGRRFTATKSTWSQRHHAWLRAQTWPLPALTQTHEAYLRAVDEAVARLRAVEIQLQDLVTLEPLRTRVQRLRCFRGMDDITALAIAAELGDARRFPSARGLMAYVGLIPSEHSSGTKRARGAITKTGNAHLRRVLVEAAWHYRHHPFIGKQLRHRPQGVPPAALIPAWRAQQRLSRRYQRLAARGKPKQHVVTAIARELTGFVWATLIQ